MIHELSQADLARVQTLFQPLAEYRLFCAGVVHGRYPGRVFVDDPAKPQTAFLLTRGMWGYLAGDPGNNAFNRALNQALFSREIVDDGVAGLLMSCHPEGWRVALVDVCAPREPIPMLRRHYVCRQVTYAWQAHIPEGVEIRPAEAALLEWPALEIPHEVKEMIEAQRATGNTADVGDGFGFVALQGDRIIAYAVVDCIAGDAGDIGLFTQPDHRRRGLATATSAATMTYGLAHGLSRITWDCAEHNLGSIRTAERLGLVRERDHLVFSFAFDEVWHLAQLAYAHLQAGRYGQAIAVYDRFFARHKDPPAWAYHDVARAWAAIGDLGRTLENLQTAAEGGWTELDETLSCQEFKALPSTPEWAAVLERIQQNAQVQGAS